MNKSEERVFEKFIKKYEQRTVNFLSSKYSTLSEESIRDIIQDSLVTLHKNIEAKKWMNLNIHSFSRYVLTYL